MAHSIPKHYVDSQTSSPDSTKTKEASNLQNHIQEILGDTHHTFLQGSYKNTTATSKIDDVDVVAIRLKTYSGKHSPSSDEIRGSILWDTIFSEIEVKLKNQAKYLWRIYRDDKCIKVLRNGITADVVPAVKVYSNHLKDPISIFSFKKGKEFLNYPRTHHDNGVLKHDLTNQRYKPAVRMFKNWTRNHFGEDQPLSSYQVESLVYNCSEKMFFDDHAISFLGIGQNILSLLNSNNPIMSVCGGEDITANWDMLKRIDFYKKLEDSLNYVTLACNSITVHEAERNWKLAFNLKNV